MTATHSLCTPHLTQALKAQKWEGGSPLLHSRRRNQTSMSGISASLPTLFPSSCLFGTSTFGQLRRSASVSKSACVSLRRASRMARGHMCLGRTVCWRTKCSDQVQWQTQRTHHLPVSSPTLPHYLRYLLQDQRGKLQEQKQKGQAALVCRISFSLHCDTYFILELFIYSIISISMCYLCND